MGTTADMFAKRRTPDLSATVAGADTVVMNVRMVGAMAQQIAASLDDADSAVGASTTASSSAVLAADELQERMSALSELVQQVDAMVRNIRQMAQHTKLIALNAAVEAAHARAAGRGFAVVANEVKRLSAETESATDTIAATLQSIRKAVSSADTVAQKARELVNTARASVAKASATVREQREMARAIPAFIDEAAQSIEAMSAGIQRAAQELEEQAKVEEEVDINHEPRRTRCR
jgi:methyl-accepting chemotaxis protein